MTRPCQFWRWLTTRHRLGEWYGAYFQARRCACGLRVEYQYAEALALAFERELKRLEAWAKQYLRDHAH